MISPPPTQQKSGARVALRRFAFAECDADLQAQGFRAGHFLAAEGFTAHTAVDGRDALEKLRTGRYRVLVTDLEMPRMHGYDLLREIRNDAKLKDLPVVVCSSRSSEKHRRRAQEAGANGYLTKPFTQASLAAVLRDALA